MKTKYLFKKDHIFYYKRKIPNTNISVTVSLLCDSLSKAKRLVGIINQKSYPLFFKVSKMSKITDRDELQVYIKSILKKYVLEAILEYEELENLRHEDFTYTHDDGRKLDGGHPLSIEKALLEIDTAIFNKDSKAELVGRILQRSNITDEELDKIPDDKIDMFYTKLLKAENEVLLYDKSRNERILTVPNLLKDEFREFTHYDGNTTYEQNAEQFQQQVQIKAKEDNPFYENTAEELKKAYLEKRTAEGLRDPKRYETDIDMLLQITGKKYLIDMKQKDMQDFVNVLKKLPDFNKHRKLYDSKTYREIAELYEKEQWELLSVNTVNNRIIRISAFLDDCVDSEVLDRNRLANKKTKVMNKKKAQKWERVSYTKEDLTKFFNSEWYQKDLIYNLKHTPDKIFVALLSLYHGFRQNEICSLYVKDITDIYGIPCIYIREDEFDKTIKKGTSEREVPIHPKILEIGFMKFVEHQRQQGYERLFPNLFFTKKKGYGQAFSKKFNRKSVKEQFIDLEFYKPDAKLRKDFHSFRHTFTEQLKGREDVPDGALDYINGHMNNSESQKRYGRHQKPRLLNILNKLDYELDFEDINNGINVVYGK